MIDENDAQNILRTKEVDSGKIENQETRKREVSAFKGLDDGYNKGYSTLKKLVE